MTIRTRKFFGTIALLVLVVVWSLLGMTVAQTPWLANSGLLQAIFYVVAGIGWVLPAMPIVSWMSRPDALELRSFRVGRHRREGDARTASPASCAANAAGRPRRCAAARADWFGPAASTTPGIADTALAKPASSAIATCCAAKAARSPNG